MKDKNTFDYLEQLEAIEIPMLKEELVPYAVHKKQGEFTIDDYNRFPDEQRVELIDGIIYDMTAPTYIHQGIAGAIYNIFFNHIRKNKGNCLVFISPADVQLDCNNKTMVQPDVFIICDKNKLKKSTLRLSRSYSGSIISVYKSKRYSYQNWKISIGRRQRVLDC